MRFGPVKVADALGGVVAHAVRHGDLVLRKGTVIGPDEVALLTAAGVDRVVVALAEPGDLAENEAAFRLAMAVAGGGVHVEPPFTGRSNLFAHAAGVLLVEGAAIDRANAIDEAVTIATLAPFKAVAAGEMIATVKIIPFAVEEALVRAASAVAAGALAVAPFRRLRVSAISTLLPGLKTSIVDKTIGVLAERLAGLAGSGVGDEWRTPHDTAALAEALRRAVGGADDLVVVFGASAITDRRDVIPAAIAEAGGQVLHLGMPVDPGNLLLIGEIAGKPVIGAPGCARSPKENGFDWVLQRFSAGLPVTKSVVQGFGVGGLLMEIVSRPQPRAPQPADAKPPVTAIVLAAGQSSRMGANKMIAMLGGKPMVRHAVEAALASRARPVLVVLGHEAEAVRAALEGLPVQFVDNPAFAEGLSTSLKAGVAQVPAEAAGALVLLGDMPHLQPATIDALIAAFADRPSVKAAAPVAGGRRANPVLIGRALFDAVGGLEGDVGAKWLLKAAGEDVIEIAVEDDGVLTDIDTPAALAAARSAQATDAKG
jgi:molybdenum cofactor cytidylyltransferase